MRQATLAAAVAAAVLAFPPGVSSQSDPNGHTGGATDTAPHPAECDYDACALRLRDSNILRGRSGERVAGFGFFRPPDMGERFARSDSATWHLAVVEESYTPGRVISLAAQVVSVAGGLLYFSSDRTTQGWGFALQAIGFSAGWLGQRRVGRAEEAMSRAIWWYNRDLAGGAASAAGRR